MKEITPYLKEVEKYLVDLPIHDRNKIISELNSQISENTEILKQPSFITANNKRTQHGFENYEMKKQGSSFGKTIFRTFAFMFVCFLIFLGFLMWKFSPLLKIDEENQKITILGGLIDIDGEAGRFIIGDEVHFTVSNYTNDLTGSIEAKEIQSVVLAFESGSFDIEANETNEITFECKLSSPPTADMLQENIESVEINFEDLDGSNCTFKIPQNIKFIAKGQTANFELNRPIFDIDLEFATGNVNISPNAQRTYFYDLNVATGNISDFESSPNNTAEHSIRVKLDTGNISQ